MKKATSSLTDYAALLVDIKQRIRQSQTRAMLAVNAELIRLYWDIGRIIAAQQSLKGWGAGVIPRLANDLKNELPEVKGFSERNIGSMIAFFRAYPEPDKVLQQAAAKLETPAILQQPAAKLESKTELAKKNQNYKPGDPDSLLWAIPWYHHVILLSKVKDIQNRLWYMQATIQHGWSRTILELQIKNKAHERQGKAVNNFDAHLPPVQSDLVEQSLKDPYIFDFLTLSEPFEERELETGLLQHLQRFLLELGQGFAFVGRQYHVTVGEDDYYIDLLFYHLRLRCFIAIDLKKGKFKPEYAGKMNFYLSVIDDKLKHSSDAPSIGMILCQDRNKVVAEYALRGMTKPIGVSEYELTRALPESLKSSLPSIEAIEAELTSSEEQPKRLLSQPAKQLPSKANRKRGKPS